MKWALSHRADPAARVLADRHYNRQKVGSAQFVPPGRCLVLACDKAFWITSWPFGEYVRHAWAGAWVCSAFRNEGAGLSSELIREAVAVTRWRWPDAPAVEAWRISRKHDRTDIERIYVAMVTFVDREKTNKKRDPGRCFRRAGFVEIGETVGGLVALGLPLEALPPLMEPHGAQQTLFVETAHSIAAARRVVTT